MMAIERALLAAAVFVGLIGLAFVARTVGLRFVGRGMAQQVQSIRAFDVMGTGVRLLGIHPTDRPGVWSATYWVTVLYFPAIPLGRRLVQFVDPGFSQSRWLTIEATELDWREGARTFLLGWVGVPLLLVGPWVLAVSLDELVRWLAKLAHLSRDLSTLVQAISGLVSVCLVLFGIPWFAIAIYRLLRWDRDRKRPNAPSVRSYWRLLGSSP